MTKTVKVLSETILSNRFCKLSEYELQMPSLSKDGFRVPVKREVMQCRDSVVVLIYARDKKSFILCEEYRTGIALSAIGDDALLLQCPAGMIDKDKSPEDIARMEAMEEVGVTVEGLVHIASVYASPGRMTEKTHLYYAEIETAPEENLYGLPEEGEEIRSRVISKSEIYKMMDEKKIIDSMTFNCLNWFRARDRD